MHTRGISWLRAQIIDSILDYSKLEASGELTPPPREREVDGTLSAVKLDSSAFSIENIVAVRRRFSLQRFVDCIAPMQDCLELLLPLAAERMDLSYYIDPNVPACKQQQTPPSSALTVPPQGIHSDYARIRQGNRARVLVSFNN